MGIVPIEGKTRLLVIEEIPRTWISCGARWLPRHWICQLTVVDDGADALSLFRLGSATSWAPPAPDLAIVDLNLPKHSGLEIIEQMRANPKFAEVPARCSQDGRLSGEALHSEGQPTWKSFCWKAEYGNRLQGHSFVPEGICGARHKYVSRLIQSGTTKCGTAQ
jgi:CheY-like chemotaxis protein